ncbi:hypothetical protein VTK73DRAFT_2687 [Phialemonium thermophilum]|uniref:Uncharacterized protein n=1 Tax=Phialemonium thermophilum TaxID=223376 RepID=A0ABR3VQM2_9PEZI
MGKRKCDDNGSSCRDPELRKSKANRSADFEDVMLVHRRPPRAGSKPRWRESDQGASKTKDEKEKERVRAAGGADDTQENQSLGQRSRARVQAPPILWQHETAREAGLWRDRGDDSMRSGHSTGAREGPGTVRGSCRCILLLLPPVHASFLGPSCLPSVTAGVSAEGPQCDATGNSLPPPLCVTDGRARCCVPVRHDCPDPVHHETRACSPVPPALLFPHPPV